MRKSRLVFPGARYHVTGRVNNREFLLERQAAKALLENVLIRAKERFNFESDTYVIMGNHYHIMIKPHKTENLSRIMQWIMSVYAMSYNRLSGRSGHFWGERFFSRIINSFQEYLQVLQYIELNPVTAGLVGNPWDWAYSGAQQRFNQNKWAFNDSPLFMQLIYRLHNQLTLSIELL